MSLDAKSHRESINRASVERDFYLLELDDGTISDEFEDFMGLIEGLAGPAFHQVVDEGVWPIEQDTRYSIAAWIALQHLRSPAMRRMLDEFAEAALKLDIAVGGKAKLRTLMQEMEGRAVDDDEVDDMWRSLSDFDSYRMRQHPNEHLRLILDMLQMTTRMFYERGWWLIRFNRRALITSDTPVVLIPNPADPMRSTGTFTAQAAAVAIDRRVALVLVGLHARDQRIPGTTRWWRVLNTGTAGEARRCIYHHPDDKIDSLRLPPPRPRETHRHLRDLGAIYGSA